MELTEEEVQSLYSWIDDIPISKPKRNITRDFSDGVAAAEVIKYFLPKFVEMHNYSPANSGSQKLYNWNTLNQKVLKKIGYTAPDSLIDAVVNCKPGYVELLLYGIRAKLEDYLVSKGKIQPGDITERGLTRITSNPQMQVFLPQLNRVPNPNGYQMNPYGMEPMSPVSPSPFNQSPYQSHHPLPTNFHFTSQPLPPPATLSAPTSPIASGFSSAASSGNKSDSTTVKELQETIQILQLKVTKLEQLLMLKDKRIDELQEMVGSKGRK